MIGFLAKLIPAPYRIMAAAIAAAVVFGAGVTAGYQVRDYFADRKEVKTLKAELEQTTKDVVKWKEEAARQTARAVKAEGERQANHGQAERQKASVDTSKLTHTVQEKCDAQTDTVPVEHTAPCHWLQLNAAYAGTDPPAECTVGLPDVVPGQQLQAAGVGREGDGARPPRH